MRDTSQGGESSFLLLHFKDADPKKSFLVDVGAYGAENSNTMGLLQWGWQGLLIEANPERIPVIDQDFIGCNYKLLNIAVGDKNGTAKLLLHSRVGSSSFLPTWEPQGANGNEVEVTMRVFAETLRENAVPVDFDLLQVDAEGMDKDIIDGLLRTEFRPKAIMTEVYSYGPDTQAVLFFKQRGYRFVKRFEPGNRWGNMFFVREP